MRQVVIDIDLDFFVTPIHLAANSDEEPRLSDNAYEADRSAQVADFMERFLGLSPKAPVPGSFVKHHHEVFFVWEKLIATGRLTPGFAVVHVDAHDDLHGRPDSTSVRSDNYLLHAIRRGWLAHLCFIHCAGSDMPPDMYLKEPYKYLKVDSQIVEFSLLAKPETLRREFHLSPDFLFLAQSPGFTPPKADALIPMIKQFIAPL